MKASSSSSSSFDLFSRFEFQGIGADDFQVRSTLIATDGVAFVDVFFIHIDLASHTGHSTI
jgi:hypothetical protein